MTIFIKNNLKLTAPKGAQPEYRQMQVKNMTGRTGNPVANQFIIYDDYGNVYFQSYLSTIVKLDQSGQVLLDDRTWDYSNTTAKYRREFLGEGVEATRAKIASGEYILTNLNE